MNVTVSASCNAIPPPGPCGGQLTGRYCYTAFCVSEALLLADIQSACANAGGAIAFSNTAGTVNGSLDFTGTGSSGAVTRNATLTITGNAAVPTVCVPGGQCGLVQQAFTQAGATAQCQTSASGCACSYTYVVPTGTSTTFTTAGNVVTVGTIGMGNQRTYDYCATSGLRYRETTSDPAEPGVATLSQ